ncbi:MAG: helix-turn-helix transcriptional regulator [Sphingomonadales bacterium]|nr:helix-turn-helix transcriptional regulator [Sphingomonadales bacterium]MDE2172295.1 helix-turn-helix transcriptional regulator [Sphingomonadales bacterium]
MDIERLSSGTCAIARAATVMGDAWTLLILRDAGLGLTRFDQFRCSLGIAPNILTRRLTAMVAQGLLERRQYQDHPPRHEYVLTESGRDLLPVLMALGAWARRNCGSAPTSSWEDTETGRPIDPIVVDRATGQPIGEIEMRMVMPDTESQPQEV